MLLLAGVVFLTVFALAALLLSAGSSRSPKQLRATLDAALKRSRFSKDDEIVDVRKNSLLSTIPSLNRLLAKMSAALELRRLLDQADLKWTPSRLVLTAIAASATVAYVISLRTGGGPICLLLGLAAGAVPFYYVLRKRRKRFNLIQKKLPDTLDLMVSALRAGHSMVGALGHAANEAPEPLGRELRLCFEEQNFGIDLRSAVQNLIARVPLQDIRIVTTAMLINRESGGNLAEVLEKTAHVIRERFRLQQQIRVHTAQGRMTGVILSLMPLVLGCLMYIANPAYIRFLFTNAKGVKMLEIAGTMNLLGMLIIRKIVNIRV